MFFSRLIDYLKNNGLIKFLLIVYCICVAYIFFYCVYQLIKFVHHLGFKERNNDNFHYNYYTHTPALLLDTISWYIFNICLSLAWFISGILVIIYVIYSAAKLVLLDWLLLAIFKIFRECKALGVFDFFDKLVGIIFGFDNFIKKIGAIVLSTFEFIKQFFDEAFGVVIPGYRFNAEYVSAIRSMINDAFETGQISSEKRKNIIEALAGKTPLIKINYIEGEPPEAEKMNYLQSIKFNNCVKMNTETITDDANTVNILKIIFKNELAREECLKESKAYMKQKGEEMNQLKNYMQSNTSTNINKLVPQLTYPNLIIDDTDSNNTNNSSGNNSSGSNGSSSYGAGLNYNVNNEKCKPDYLARNPDLAKDPNWMNANCKK